MGGITINGQFYTFDKIKTGGLPNGLPPWARKVFIFANDWLNGRESFSIATSGTTGTRKTILLTRKQMDASALMTNKHFGLEQEDTAVLCMNPEYIAGQMMIVRSIVGNMNLIITEASADPFEQLEDVERIDFIAVVPLQLESLLSHKHYLRKFKKSKAILVGGGQISSVLEKKVRHAKLKTVYQTFGMTETVTHVAVRNISQGQQEYVLMPGVSAGADDRGCIYLQGAVTNDKVIQTNDQVVLLDNAKFIWKGRADNVINSGGVKVFPEEIEDQLSKLFETLDLDISFFIGGLPDDVLGQKVVLFTEGNIPIDDEHLLQKMKNELPKYHAPRMICHCERFLRTETGKVKREATITN